MPEGDTIHRTAASLRGVLEAQTLQLFAAPRLTTDGPAPGTCIEQVEARDKHLLVHFTDGLVLHAHLRMDGSWHVYRPGGVTSPGAPRPGYEPYRPKL